MPYLETDSERILNHSDRIYQHCDWGLGWHDRSSKLDCEDLKHSHSIH